MELTLEKKAILSMEKATGKRVINLSGHYSIDWNKELSIDENKYKLYKNNYVKMNGTEELPFWQIVANRIKNY